MTDLTLKIVTSEWLSEILVDPITKKSLHLTNENYYTSEDNFIYSLKDGVPDFRIRLNKSEKEWTEGQFEFEKWKIKYLEKGELDNSFYLEEQKRDKPMYDRLKLEGRVLDVGGQLGNIRKYLYENNEYCTIDPFIDVWKLVKNKKNLFAYYPYHIPLNFLGGYAEFLPILSKTIGTINMRSCIDHFFNPELALIEANRVLINNGKLIIGMTVKIETTKTYIKNIIRNILGLFTKKFEDHHIWHPSRDEIVSLCNSCGFEFEDEIWQSEEVWYGSFRKKNQFLKVT